MTTFSSRIAALSLCSFMVCAADAPPDCKAIRDSAERLNCYDGRGAYKNYNYYQSESEALNQRVRDHEATIQRLEAEVRQFELEEQKHADRLIEIKERGRRRNESIDAEIDCLRNTAGPC